MKMIHKTIFMKEFWPIRRMGWNSAQRALPPGTARSVGAQS